MTCDVVHGCGGLLGSRVASEARQIRSQVMLWCWGSIKKRHKSLGIAIQYEAYWTKSLVLYFF